MFINTDLSPHRDDFPKEIPLKMRAPILVLQVKRLFTLDMNMPNHGGNRTYDL